LGDTEGSHRFPQFLPDGRHLIFAKALGAPSTRGIFGTSLDGESPRRFMENATIPVFARPDWLLYVNQGTLMARHFDPARLLVSGDPIVVDRNVGADTAIVLGAFSASSTVLAHRSTTGVRRQLVWMDRTGKVLTALGAPDDTSIASPQLSPDGRRVAVSRNTEGSNNIWIIDVARAFPTRFTFDSSSVTAPVWTADGSRVVFRTTRSGGGDLFEKPTSGTAADQTLLTTPDAKWASDITVDGKLLLFVNQDQKTYADLLALPLTGDKKPFPVVKTKFEEVEGQFSPDGQWLAYTSNESGPQQVYVQPFPGPGDKVQVSTAGGRHPRWRRDGKELFYVALDGSLMAAAVNRRSSGTLDVASPITLFAPHWATGSNIFTSGGAQRPQYAVAADGRFLVNVSVDEASLKPITVVLNWQSVLKK
jgi:Tol biopolymer transport system component